MRMNWAAVSAAPGARLHGDGAHQIEDRNHAAEQVLGGCGQIQVHRPGNDRQHAEDDGGGGLVGGGWRPADTAGRTARPALRPP